MSEVEKTQEVKQTASEMDAEIKAVELALKKAQLLDAQDQLHERQAKRESRMAKAKANGANIGQNRMQRNAQQTKCNHGKGGDGAKGVIGGEGTDQQYSVLKHKFANGDTWIRCTRCAKTWKPPLKDRYKSQEAYQAAVDAYNIAVSFPTRNQTSSSQQFQWGFNAQGEGGPEFYRKIMANVNLE